MFTDYLIQFMKNKQCASEVEIRFHNRGMFKDFGGVPSNVFQQIKYNLDNDSQFVIDNKCGEKTTTYQQEKSNTRIIVNNVTKIQTAQEKTKVKHFDLKSYNFRIAEAKERNIEVNINLAEVSKTASSIREKHRYTYVHLSKFWKIDITKVIQNQNTVYEIELEFMNKDGNLKEICNIGNSIIIKLLQLCQHSDYIISNEYATDQLNTYAQLLRLNKPLTFTRTHPLPFTISKEQFDSGELSCGYSVTGKADGSRVILFTNSKGEASYVTRFKAIHQMFQELVFIGHVFNMHKNTMVDCELIGGIFYAFDVLVANGIDVREKSLPERLQTISSFTKPSSTKIKYQMIRKEFYITDTYANAHKIWKNRKSYPYELDGLVFTPIYQRYNNDKIYKWKSHNTIDFYIEKQRTTLPLEKWKLHIGSFDKKSVYQHLSFNGIDGKFYHKYKSQDLVETELLIPKSLQYATVSNKIGATYPDKSVVEMKFVKDNWVPVKHREDKSFANNIPAVNDAWIVITKPITLANIKKGVDAFCGRKFHNAIKDHIIGKYMKNKLVLDIGSGAGGDIPKYKRHQISQVVGIDIVNVEYPYDKSKMRFYKTEDNLYRIKNLIKTDKVKQFDIVNCQFALHYFFKTEKTLSNFISNVNENLKSNGFLVTTFIDAKSLISKSTLNKYKTKIVDIKIGKINEKLTGNKVTVALKGTKYFGTGKK